MLKQQLQSFLDQHYLFSPFSNQAKNSFYKQCTSVQLNKDEILFNQGSHAANFYLVVSGTISLYRLSPYGDAKVMEVVRAGETFAEALIFSAQHKFPVTATAIDECKLLIIPGNLYKKLLLQEPHCALKMMANMSKKLHQRLKEIENLSLQNTRHRLGHYLLGLAPAPEAGHCEFCLPIEKRLIASKLGMQPETFSRVLKELKQQKILSIQGRHVSVYDVEALKSFGHH